ncbi:putative transcription factor WD40-like family [Helianthus debilis subsp. tardiflorus]
MFSAGDDKQVKCWDLEQNKVIREYHDHLSGVYCLALHPTIDVLLTNGRGSICRAWDIRSKTQIHALSGHGDMVCLVFTRTYGKAMATLTHHKKSVRALAQHPTKDCFASASADNIKEFSLPRGEFLRNMLTQQKTIINAMTVNQEGVLATGGDNGSLWFWDWKSGHRACLAKLFEKKLIGFLKSQKLQNDVWQPGCM